MNRQVILSMGVSRESLHYNTVMQYQPLAEISAEDTQEFSDLFSHVHSNFYDTVKKFRKKNEKYIRKAKVPEFHPNQLVFVQDQAPGKIGRAHV